MNMEKKRKPRKPCIFLVAILHIFILAMVQASAHADACAVALMPPFTSAQASKLCATFVGTSTISASLIPGTDNAYDIGDATHALRSLYVETSIIGTGSGTTIGASTADAADSASLNLVGGGADGGGSTARGSYVTVFGNEHATQGGRMFITGGNVATGNVDLRVVHSSAAARILNGSNAVVESFVLPYVPTMAATPVAGTNQILPGLNVIPTAAANTAAMFPATPVPDARYYIKNSNGTNSVRVKGGGATTINGATAGGYIVLAAGVSAMCRGTSTSNIDCYLPPQPTPAGP